MLNQAAPEHRVLLRHFADLRDGVHGDQRSRAAKESVFISETDRLSPIALDVLESMNTDLLLGSGLVTDSGASRTGDGSMLRVWSLSWPEQRTHQLPPVALVAYFGVGFHHPHLRGTTVEDWPLNVESAADAEAYRAFMTAIAVSDLHNLVFAATFDLIPATTRGGAR